MKYRVVLLQFQQLDLSRCVRHQLLQVAAGASVVAKTEAAHGYASQGNTVLRFTMTVAEFHQ
ncbi:hypothetical protein [Enterobacter cancerogenus]|uniref:hypothetical protein n=1 Tax=Enterobacter cancerogenus TaxID=69218 RepID=UPI003FA346C1